MTATMNLTAARRRGLEALASVHPRSALRSNSTVIDRANPLNTTVYWQTSDWLVEAGLVAPPLQPGNVYLQLTSDGIDACHELGITVRT